MLENLDKIMHLRFNFDACPMHSPSGFVHLTHQNLSARALFCLNSLAKVNTQLLIYKYLALYSGVTLLGVPVGKGWLSAPLNKHLRTVQKNEAHNVHEPLRCGVQGPAYTRWGPAVKLLVGVQGAKPPEALCVFFFFFFLMQKQHFQRKPI